MQAKGFRHGFCVSCGMMNRRTLLGTGAGVIALAGAATNASAAFFAHDFGIVANIARDQSTKLQRALNAAAKKGGMLHLPAGIYIARKLKISSGVAISGVPGLTRLVLGRPADYLLKVSHAANVTLSGIIFDGANHRLTSGNNASIVNVANTDSITIDQCRFQNSSANGIALEACSGRLTNCTVTSCLTGGIFSLDARSFEIAHNSVSKIGDNGIMVWRSTKGEDGTLVHDNRIDKIFAKSGGNGQNGNGIGVYKANNVVVTGNRISNCEFSAVRDNQGDNIQITDNNCSHLNEVAIFVEFAFQGAVVSGNMIEKAGMGISITNFNEGGRLAVCANNVVRDMLGAISNPDTQAIGIAVEADTAVTGNVVENAKRAGIWLGWGKYLRDVSATGNIVRASDIGIAVSVVPGSKNTLIANNLVSGAVQAIAGMDHDKIVTGDLSQTTRKTPKGVMVTGNLVS